LIGKFLVTALLFASSVNAADDNAKFLVVDGKTYNKIQVLNILNGGIEKEYIVSSLKLSQKSLEKYYPEYFIYSGLKCNVINKIYTNGKKSNTKINLLTKENDIKNEVKKVKLLQMLNDENPSNISTSSMNPELIKALGVLCGNRLFLRGQSFGANDVLGNTIIKNINSKNSTISLESK